MRQLLFENTVVLDQSIKAIAEVIIGIQVFNGGINVKFNKPIVNNCFIIYCDFLVSTCIAKSQKHAQR